MTGQASKRKFRRQGFMIARIGEGWKKPKGRHSKQRQKWKNKGAWPHPGYRRANSGMHPCGLYEVMVHNAKDLSTIDPKTHCARISGSVGNKKKIVIVDEAQKLKIRVLNPAVKK